MRQETELRGYLCVSDGNSHACILRDFSHNASCPLLSISPISQVFKLEAIFHPTPPILPFFPFSLPFHSHPHRPGSGRCSSLWDFYFHSLPTHPVCVFLFINSLTVNYRVLLTHQIVLNTINKQGMRWWLSLLFKAVIWSSHPWEPPWLVHDMPWTPLVFGSYLSFLLLGSSLHLTLLTSFPNFKVPQIISFRLSPFFFPIAYCCPF